MFPDQDQRLGVTSHKMETLRKRSQLLNAVRAFFAERDYLEVTTPSLVCAPDPACHLESFSTEFFNLFGPQEERRALFLPTSPEHHMKRLLAAGLERIYQICPFFRNGEISPVHNPEFTGLEWYQTHQRFDEMMQQTERLVVEVAQRVRGRTSVERHGRQIDLTPPYVRISVREAIEKLAGIPLPENFDEHSLRVALRNSRVMIDDADRFDDLVNKVLIERVEPLLENLGPVFLTDYPAQMAAMARLDPDNRSIAQRFELFIGGLELCNGYAELTDAAEQRARFLACIEQRKKTGRHVPPLDEAFLEALRHMPQACGNAMGLDRLLMLLLEKERIEDVIAFPMQTELTHSSGT